METGDNYQLEFRFTQNQVEDFARLTGDSNPLHLDPDYASRTLFKKPIIHGVLGASIFSKIMGTLFPGEGTIYLSQQLEFKRPMYVDTTYKALVQVNQTNPDKHTATLTTRVLDNATDKLVIDGEALVMNKDRI